MSDTGEKDNVGFGIGPLSPPGAVTPADMETASPLLQSEGVLLKVSSETCPPVARYSE